MQGQIKRKQDLKFITLTCRLIRAWIFQKIKKPFFFQICLFQLIKANLLFLIFAWSENFREKIADSSRYSILLILFLLFRFDAACIKLMLICIKLLHASSTLPDTLFHMLKNVPT